jgi:hypothetical protein
MSSDNSQLRVNSHEVRLGKKLEESESTPQVPECLPEIIVPNQLRDMTRDSLRALQQANEPPTMFVRLGSAVYVSVDERRRATIEMIDADYLRGKMSRAANYFSESKEGLTHRYPPAAVVNDILSLQAADWGFPPLESITEIPLLRPDGTLVRTVGYDPVIKVVYSPAPDLTVCELPDEPTANDLKSAVDLILELLGEFPFKDDASRANAVALLLTPCIRNAIQGQVAIALIDAPQPGTGKSLLARLVSEIATGGDAAMMNAPREEEEWRKSITATLMSGTRIVIYDNLQHPLQSAGLAMALTTPAWKDRVLGVSQTVTIPQLCTWMATGNNIRLGGDLARRCYWIRLDSRMSQPWTRGGFRHPDLIAWARDHRGEIVGALLTIARGWFAAGSPTAPVQPLGSFEQWANPLAGILAYAGIKGFLENLQELYSLADDSSPQWEGFLTALGAEVGEGSFSVSELAERLQSDRELRESLPEDLLGAWGDKEPASNGFRTKLGKAFKARAGTRFGADPVFLERAGTESRGGQVRWRVVRAGMQGSQGCFLPSRDAVGVPVSEATGTTLPTLQPCDQEPE